MGFTSLEGTVIHKGPYPALGFTASGTIYGGQVVQANADGYVTAGTSDAVGLGIALYDATIGNGISVLGPGNVVYCRISGTSETTPTTYSHVVCGVEGYCKASASGTTNAFGRIVDLPSTNGGIGKILVC